MLVSGVWRLWLTPRRKSSFAASSSRSWAFCASTRANSCGVPDRHRDLAREQLEQVLVGAFPGPRGGQAADEHAELLLAGLQERPDRQRIARESASSRGCRGIDQEDVAVDHAERRLGVGRGAAGDEHRAVSRRGPLDRGKDAAELPVPPFEVDGEPVVALGETRQLVVARDLDRRRQVAGGDAVDGGGDGPERRDQVRREQVREQDADQGRDDDREQERRPKVSASVEDVARDEATTPNPASGRTAAATSPASA